MVRRHVRVCPIMRRQSRCNELLEADHAGDRIAGQPKNYLIAGLAECERMPRLIDTRQNSICTPNASMVGRT